MATKPFVRMTRTQTGAAGTFHAGTIYHANAAPATAEALAAYLKRGFAEGLTKKEVEALTAPQEAAEKAPQGEE